MANVKLNDSSLRNTSYGKPVALALGAILGMSGVAETSPAAAMSCDFQLLTVESPHISELSDLPEGASGGKLDCGGTPTNLIIWTTSVDADAKHLGVRDNPLFSERRTGPLTKLYSADIDGAARISVFEGTETAKLTARHPTADRKTFRRFATFCEASHSGDPMDCSLSGMRLKARVTAKDTDRDGLLDLNLNEISIYDGHRRLQVIAFHTDYSLRAEAHASDWIKVIDGLSNVLVAQAVAELPMDGIDTMATGSIE